MAGRKSRGGLHGTRVYLSGPMDFVASREQEMKGGWRNRVGEFLKAMEVTVFDPWKKPKVRWFHEYGREDTGSLEKVRDQWTFDAGIKGKRRRAECAELFRQTLHVDLRMVDTADFVIAYCPTNVYSVGTVHEIILASTQQKPVLFVSPPVVITALERLRSHLGSDSAGLKMLKELEEQVPIRSNPRAIPSLWYVPLLGGHSFFDGFGFSRYADEFGWGRAALDQLEKDAPPRRPLLPFLRKLDGRVRPRKFDLDQGREVRDDNWLLWDLES